MLRGIIKHVNKTRRILIFQLIIISILLIQSFTIMQFNNSGLNKVSASSSWTQTTESDFNAGFLNHVTVSPEGDVKLSQHSEYIRDDFINESKISLKNNVLINTSAKEVTLQRVKCFSRFFYNSYDNINTVVRQTSDDGYIIVAQVRYGGSDNDIWLIKTDDDGNMQWNKTFGGSEGEGGYAVQQTSDGGYIILGHTYSYAIGQIDVWLIKTNSTGDEQWNTTYGYAETETANALVITNDGGYIFAGIRDTVSRAIDVWVVKTDKDGIMEWNNSYGGIQSDCGYYIEKCSDGGYIITGYTRSYGPAESNVWLIKINSTGSEEWNKTFGGSSSESGYYCQETFDGGYVIIGPTGSFGAGGTDFWLIKTNDTGVKEWDKTFGGNDLEANPTGQQTTDGGYIITGYTASNSAKDRNYWLIKTNDTGVKTWDRIFNNSYYDSADSVRQTTDGGYIISGSTENVSTGDFDIWLIKTNDLGKVENKVNGSIISVNLLKDQNTSSINNFKYSARVYPDTTVKVQFSQDKQTWYNSMGILDSWNYLKDGENSIDLSSLNWLGNKFHYKMELVSNNSIVNVPAVENINISFDKYERSGTLRSSAFNADGMISWMNLTWNGITPTDTEVIFQLRSANQNVQLAQKSFVGPDGSLTTYYITPGSAIYQGHGYEKWMQFKVYLFTQNTSQTPILQDVTINFNYHPSPPTLETPLNNTWTNNNKPTFTWKFNDLDSSSQTAFQWEMDDSNDFSSLNYDSWIVGSSETSYTSPYIIKDGIWYWRIRTQDSDNDWGPFSGYSILKIDTTIGTPFNLLAKPDRWSANNNFSVSWENPYDVSGIAGVYYKLGNEPKSNTDGTYVQGTDINSIDNIILNDDGEDTIYIWLKDKQGNINFNNFAFTSLYLDTTPPDKPNRLIVTPSDWTSINSFEIDWSPPEDLSGVKLGANYYIGPEPPTTGANGTFKSMKPLNITDAPEGVNNIYIWLEDNVGNSDHMNYLQQTLKLDTIPPIIVHTPITTWYEGVDITFSAEVYDKDSGVASVILEYKKPSEEEFQSIKMEKKNGNYSASLPGRIITLEGLEYYITTSDRATPSNNNYFGSGGLINIELISPINITVKEKPSIVRKSPLGSDVPVDSKIGAVFNELMNQTKTQEAFSIIPPVNGNFTWADKELIFTPDQPLDYDITYTVTITKSACNLEGVNINKTEEWTFTTVKKPKEKDKESTGDEADSNLVYYALVPVIIVIIIFILFFIIRKRPYQYRPLIRRRPYAQRRPQVMNKYNSKPHPSRQAAQKQISSTRVTFDRLKQRKPNNNTLSRNNSRKGNPRFGIK